ncbi:hypothetical protein V7S43_009827 [Phytophthora oleae]|uniref:Uncharacterized protein n=1 Tax=Phytophthora oleae TaxID=2107226 RepID=A0ABD3FI17_9STRA
MPTILELIQVEKQAQDEEEARPPIVDVESSRSFIMETKPDPSENISLETCVLRVEEFDKMFRIDLIDRELESEGEALLKTFDSLDLARRSKFVFQLTIWKNCKTELNRLEYGRGFSYRFEKVHSLRLLYGNPAGSMQIRQLLRAHPLPFADEGGAGHVIHSPTSGCADSSRFSIVKALSPLQHTKDEAIPLAKRRQLMEHSQW